MARRKKNNPHIGGNKQKPLIVSRKSSKDEPVVYRDIAKHWTQIGLFICTTMFSSLITYVFGFTQLSDTIPIISFIQNHQLAAIIIGCGLAIVTIIAWLIFPTAGPKRKRENWRIRTRDVATATSSGSFLLCFGLLLILLLRPSWCPSPLCTQTTNPLGVHDANLDAYFLTFESNAFVIPGDPEHTSPVDISDEKNSHIISAATVKGGNLFSVYRVVIVVHSLYQGRYSILIDQIALTVVNRPPLPHLLKVWPKPSIAHYNVSRYGITYRGQGNASILPAKYLYSPYGYTQLLSTESDQLDVQITSIIPVHLRFNMQIMYHIASEANEYTLTLPQTFDVVFSDTSTWQTYQLHAGHFVSS